MHPTSRSERRYVREVIRDRRRFMLKLVWRMRKPEENTMFWAGKQSVGHGNRCSCHYEKRFHHKRSRKEKFDFD